jgi:phosphoribosyl 1,2-cyclic phosphodiesterase
MNFISLQSGSNGNCIYVEAGGLRLLFDAGISGRQAAARLAGHGRDIADVDALIISHEHADHVRCAGVYQRRLGLPLYITEKTLAAALTRHDLGALGEVRVFRSGAAITMGSVRIETIPTAHDGVDGVAFIVDDGSARLGIFTDLGHVSGELEAALESVQGALVESNYDPAMLARGPYPAFLKKRIAGPGGHLSNDEAADLVGRCGRGLRWVCLGHLSEQNNRPECVVEAFRPLAARSLQCYLASRYGAGPVLTM